MSVCAVCGTANVNYQNYRGQWFCWPCADGDRPTWRARLPWYMRAGRLLLWVLVIGACGILTLITGIALVIAIG